MEEIISVPKRKTRGSSKQEAVSGRRWNLQFFARFSLSYSTRIWSADTTTVFTRVLVDPVYKSTPNFWGQKLDFLISR